MTGLDPEARSNFFQILDEEKARGVAIILSSHILTELEARTDRVAVLSSGRCKAIGSIAELRADLGLGSQSASTPTARKCNASQCSSPPASGRNASSMVLPFWNVAMAEAGAVERAHGWRCSISRMSI